MTNIYEGFEINVYLWWRGEKFFRVPWGRGGDMVSTSQRVPGGVFAKKLLLGQVYNRYSIQPTYWITDTTVLTWTMLKNARPWSTSTNVRMILPEVSKYLAKMAPYSSSVTADNYINSSSSAWWIASEKMGFDKELVLLASSLVGACPSSSGVERCFSTLGFTYGLNPGIYIWKAEITNGSGKRQKTGISFRQFNS